MCSWILDVIDCCCSYKLRTALRALEPVAAPLAIVTRDFSLQIGPLIEDGVEYRDEDRSEGG